MDLTRDSIVTAASKMVAADMGEDVMILHLEEGLYFGLEEVGARIWKLMQKPVVVREIERVLLEEYDVDPEECHSEVLRFIGDLVDRNLVEVRN